MRTFFTIKLLRIIMNIFNVSFEIEVVTKTKRTYFTLKWFLIPVDYLAMDDVMGETGNLFFAESTLGRYS
jgi:hypothetical protein